ncbi:hypothetical protein ACSNOI_21035 [Actinomadura kijaniata]|uniref:hypothetical protein n=1 Tax=Actinomadura kijaniata TaxID=46161 RepID=UPI003F1C55C8
MRGVAEQRHPARGEEGQVGQLVGVVLEQPAARRSGSERDRAGRDFELVFLRQVEALWARAPFPVPGEPPPPVRGRLTAYRDDLGLELPVAALHVAMGYWIRLYGLLCMEALNQLDFAYSDIAPLYEETLRDIARGIGFEYRPPA